MHESRREALRKIKIPRKVTAIVNCTLLLARFIGILERFGLMSNVF